MVTILSLSVEFFVAIAKDVSTLFPMNEKQRSYQKLSHLSTEGKEERKKQQTRESKRRALISSYQSLSHLSTEEKIERKKEQTRESSRRARARAETRTTRVYSRRRNDLSLLSQEERRKLKSQQRAAQRSRHNKMKVGTSPLSQEGEVYTTPPQVQQDDDDGETFLANEQNLIRDIHDQTERGNQQDDEKDEAALKQFMEEERQAVHSAIDAASEKRIGKFMEFKKDRRTARASAEKERDHQLVASVRKNTERKMTARKTALLDTEMKRRRENLTGQGDQDLLKNIASTGSPMDFRAEETECTTFDEAEESASDVVEKAEESVANGEEESDAADEAEESVVGKVKESDAVDEAKERRSGNVRESVADEDTTEQEVLNAARVTPKKGFLLGLFGTDSQKKSSEKKTRFSLGLVTRKTYTPPISNEKEQMHGVHLPIVTEVVVYNPAAYRKLREMRDGELVQLFNKRYDATFFREKTTSEMQIKEAKQILHRARVVALLHELDPFKLRMLSLRLFSQYKRNFPRIFDERSGKFLGRGKMDKFMSVLTNRLDQDVALVSALHEKAKAEGTVLKTSDGKVYADYETTDERWGKDKEADFIVDDDGTFSV